MPVPMNREEIFRFVEVVCHAMRKLVEPHSFDDVDAVEQASITQCLGALLLAENAAARLADVLAKARKEKAQ
jgi:hypothetical protein